jgi:carboxypeptidase Q
MGVFGVFLCSMLTGFAQFQQDTLFIRNIYNEALENGHAYARLGQLCKQIGPRLSGSDEAEKGIDWSVKMLNTYGFDSVFKQPVMVPRWERGKREYVTLNSAILYHHILKYTGHITEIQTEINKIRFSKSPYPLMECKGYLDWLSNKIEAEKGLERRMAKEKMLPLEISALGGSIGGNIQANVVVANDKNDVDSLGKRGLLKGKIVLLNRAFDETLIKTFHAYSSCVSQRVYGAVWAAPYGAKAVMIRSLSNSCDMHPHTGVTYYVDSVEKIPIAAVSTATADALEYFLKIDPQFTLSLKMNCRMLPERLSANVCAQLTGKKDPKSVIVFGGHFDSWDEGEGAHDDGAGIMHCFEALRILKVLGYEPKHTLRMVFWINEENGTRGGIEYAKQTHDAGETHLAAFESDRGGFTPRGLGLDSPLMYLIAPFQSVLKEYGLTDWEYAGGGVDINPLRKQQPLLPFGALIPDSQRYFDVHHAASDVFESVNKRELHLGAAAVAAWIYITDNYAP